MSSDRNLHVCVLDNVICFPRIVAGSLLLINYFLGDQIERNEMAEARSTYGGEERFIKDFSEETRKTPHGRPRRRWDDNIKKRFSESIM
jgi:hypothetical protein